MGAATISVPTIFSAIDKLSPTIDKINKKVGSLYSKLNEASKISLKAGLAIATAFGVLAYDALSDYDTSLAGFRTIVSDLNDTQFSGYEKAIASVAYETKRSTIEIANSFESIAGLNEKFAETPEMISKVAKANATLSKASRMDLEASADSLVGIMNQFSFGAEQADRVINVLAAGQAVGAASISQTSEAFKNFGSVASGANITLEQSVGLIQTLGKFSVFGAEAGTKLRGSVLQLQKAGLGYKSGQFQINDALAEANKRLAKLKTAKQQDAFLTKLFGAENISTGRILLNNIQIYEGFTKGVTNTSEAQKAAAINANTLKSKIDDAKNSFINFITTNEEANGTLGVTKSALGFVADNMNTIIPLVLILTAALIGFRVVMLASVVVMYAYNIAHGIYLALFTKNIMLTGVANVTQKSFIVTTYLALAAMKIYTAVQWLATAATTAFSIAVNTAIWPITLIVLAIAAVIAIFYYWDDICAWFAKQWEKFTSWIGDLWNSVVKWFEDFDFVDFFKQIGNAIIEFFLFPLKSALGLLSNLPGAMGKIAGDHLKIVDQIKFDVNSDSDKKEVLPNAQQASSEALTKSITEKRSTVDINIKDRGKNVKDVTSDDVPINLDSTKFA